MNKDNVEVLWFPPGTNDENRWKLHLRVTAGHSVRLYCFQAGSKIGCIEKLNWLLTNYWGKYEGGK